MAAVEHYYAAGVGVATVSPHATWREVAKIADPGWAAETQYLVLASALVRHYSSADQAQVRLTIGGVTLPDGALSYELTGSVQKAHYGWMYFLSDETGDLALEVSSSGGSEVTVEWGAIFVLNLDDAGLGDVDFFTGEIFTDYTTTASFVDQAATAGLTADGADTWLIIGNAMYTGVSGSSNHMMRLNDSVAGALATIDVEGEDATNDVRGYLLMAAVTPSAGSHTFSVQAAHESASCTVLSSRILAINLSACFAQHAAQYTAGMLIPDYTTPTWEAVASASPTPATTGPWFVWGAYGYDVGTLSHNLMTRLQINPDGSGLASDPAYGDAAPGTDGWDPTDITPFHLFTLATLSAGAARAASLDIRLATYGGGTFPKVQERTLVAFALEKPGAGPIYKDLAAAPAGETAVSAALEADRNLMTALTGETTVSATLAATRDLAATSAGETAIVVTLAATRDIAAAMAGDTALAASAGATRDISAAIAGSAVVTAALDNVSAGLGANIAGETTVTAEITAVRDLVAGIASETTITADLAAWRDLAVLVVGETVVTATLAAGEALDLAASIAGSTTVTATLVATRELLAEPIMGATTLTATLDGAQIDVAGDVRTHAETVTVAVLAEALLADVRTVGRRVTVAVGAAEVTR